MRTKSLVLLLLALGCGLIASIGISQVIDRGNQQEVVTEEMVDVVVAIADLKAGEKITPEKIALDKRPKSQVLEGAFNSIQTAQENPLKLQQPIFKGEMVLLGKFNKEDRSVRIPPGYRTIAIPTDSQSAAGNLLNPEDRVDVLLYIPGNGQNVVPEVKTILRNISVFAVNDKWSNSGEVTDGTTGEGKNTRFVSLLVTPEQGEVLTLAQFQGQLKLTMRSPFDNKDVAGGNDTIKIKEVLSEPASSGSVKDEQKQKSLVNDFFAGMRDLGNTIKEVEEKKLETMQQQTSLNNKPAPPAGPTFESFQMMIYENGAVRAETLAREKKPGSTQWVNTATKGVTVPPVPTTAVPGQTPGVNPASAFGAPQKAPPRTTKDYTF
jgi:Flp pilus assembly protein CpaB